MKTTMLGTTGLRISDRALGTARFGTTGTLDEGEARRVLERFADAGGTFLDTSSAYLGGRSETIVGDFLAERGRDAFVVCSKFGRTTTPTSPARMIGNHRGAMRAEVEGSLRRLRTDRIDLYLAHFDDGVTPMDELMRGFDDLSREGKIVHAGLSNFPAWRVADARGSMPIVAQQLQYNLGERAIEREHLPLARARGMTVMAWSPLGGGTLRDDTRITTVARARGCEPATIAIAWLLHKGVVPVLGARNVAQLEATLADLVLEPDEVAQLDAPFTRGYPYDLLDEVRRSLGIVASE